MADDTLAELDAELFKLESRHLAESCSNNTYALSGDHDRALRAIAQKRRQIEFHKRADEKVAEVDDNWQPLGTLTDMIIEKARVRARK